MDQTSEKLSRFISVAFPTMVGLRVLGAAISPFLFAHAPPLLIALSPFLVHLVLISPLLDPLVYFPLALTSATFQSIIGFQFGSIFGQRALTWILDRIPLPRPYVDRMLRIVQQLSIIAIFAIPGPVLGVTAGVAGVNRRIFYILVAPAQALWVTAAYFIGEALLDSIALIREFVIAHALPLTGLTLGFVLIRLLWGQRSKILGTKQ